MDKSNLDIDGAGTIAYEKISEKYNSFYEPSYRIFSDGEDVEEFGIFTVTSVTVDNSILKAGSCVITAVPDPGLMKKSVADEIFMPESCVEVYLGYNDDCEAVFIGLVKSVQFIFDAADAPEIRVMCVDLSCELMNRVSSFIWRDPKYNSFAPLAKDILSEYVIGHLIEKIIVENVMTDEKPPYKQNEESDYTFLKRIADDNHIDFFTSGHNIYYRGRRRAAPVTTLTWGINIDSLVFTIKRAAAVSKVFILGWDVKKKEKFYGEADLNGIKDRICSGRIYDYAKEAFKTGDTIWKTTSTQDREKANMQAENILIARNKHILSAEGVCVGIPLILAGRVINIEGVGELLSGEYFINGTRHTLNSSGYKTNFDIVEALG